MSRTAPAIKGAGLAHVSRCLQRRVNLARGRAAVRECAVAKPELTWSHDLDTGKLERLPAVGSFAWNKWRGDLTPPREPTRGTSKLVGRCAAPARSLPGQIESL